MSPAQDRAQGRSDSATRAAEEARDAVAEYNRLSLSGAFRIDSGDTGGAWGVDEIRGRNGRHYAQTNSEVDSTISRPDHTDNHALAPNKRAADYRSTLVGARGKDNRMSASTVRFQDDIAGDISGDINAPFTGGHVGDCGEVDSSAHITAATLEGV